MAEKSSTRTKAGFSGESLRTIPLCKEYRHTIATLVKGLIEYGFVITDLTEENFGTPDSRSEPGTPEHRSAFAPPWLIFRAKKDRTPG